jgi:hypothetical protein
LASSISVTTAQAGNGLREVDELFTSLSDSLSNCTTFAIAVLAYDVIGDMAYTAGLEHTSDGPSRD